MQAEPYIDGMFVVYPDGRRLARVIGGDGEEPEGEGEPQESEGETKPPWGSDDEFSPEKAWKLIQNVRADLDKTKTTNAELAKQVKAQEDATKTDSEKLTERVTGAETRAEKAEREAARLRVALDKGLTLAQAKRLVGDTEDELAKDADELLATFKGGDNNEPSGSRRGPQERLRSGAAPSAEPEETDPSKLAAKVPRMY